MTVEMQKVLDDALEEAVQSGDERRILAVQARILSALMDCQRKTADRVKELAVAADRAKERVKGARLLWKVLSYAASAGGGAAVLKLLAAG